MTCVVCTLLCISFLTCLCLGQVDGVLETVRLAAGSKQSQGRVEVLVNGEWGTVCDDGFGLNEALVVCRQLGYHGINVMYHREAFFGEGSGPVWMDNVGCTGSEDSLTNCTHNGFGQEDCSHSEDVGVDCDFLRLVGGIKPSQGRLEVLVKGEWGTVCDDYFDKDEALVVCRQLGYNGTNVLYRSGDFFGQGTGRIWMDNVNCTGSENNLAYCARNSFGEHNCGHSEDVGVDCDPPTVKHCIALAGRGGQVRSCYHLLKYTTTWDDAQRTCAAQGMELATISSSAEMSILRYIPGLSQNEMFWIGLRINSNRKWEWLDGISFPSDDVNWGSGQQDITNEDCGMFYNSEIRGQVCSTKHMFICEEPPQQCTAADPCSSSPCGENGDCLETSTGYVCSCHAGFTGADCNTRQKTFERETGLAKNELGIGGWVVPVLSVVAGVEMIIIVVLIVIMRPRCCLERVRGRKNEEIIAMREQSLRVLPPPSNTSPIESHSAPRAATSQAPSCSKAATPAGPTTRGNPYTRGLFPSVQCQGQDDEIYENDASEHSDENIYTDLDGGEEGEVYEVV